MINLRFILYLPIIFLFLPAFGFYMPAMKAVYQFFFIVLYASVFLVLVLDKKNIVEKSILLVKKTPIKHFLVFLFLIALDSIFMSIIGNGSIVQSIRSIIMQIFLFILPIVFFFTYIIDKYISYERFIRIFLMLIWLTLIVGIIGYLGELFNITFIDNVFDFFANTRLINPNGYYASIGMDLAHYKDFGIPRLDCLQQEPSFHARWLFIFLPLIYECSNKFVNVSVNKYLNYAIKKTIIPLAWINLILTLSPIYLVLSILLTIIMYFKKIIKIIKRFGIIIIIVIIPLAFKLNTIDLSNTYLVRILNVLTNIHSFEDFIVVEPSLAARVVCYINSFKIFLQHPVFGVGIGYFNDALYKAFLHSPVPLTAENIGKFQLASMTNSKMSYNSSIFFDNLATYGIFISGYFLFFYYQLFEIINNIQIYLTKNCNYKYIHITHVLKWLLFTQFVVMFYESTILSFELYIIIALCIAFIYKIHNKYKNSLYQETEVQNDRKNN